MCCGQRSTEEVLLGLNISKCDKDQIKFPWNVLKAYIEPYKTLNFTLIIAFQVSQVLVLIKYDTYNLRSSLVILNVKIWNRTTFFDLPPSFNLWKMREIGLNRFHALTHTNNLCKLIHEPISQEALLWRCVWTNLNTLQIYGFFFQCYFIELLWVWTSKIVFSVHISVFVPSISSHQIQTVMD